MKQCKNCKFGIKTKHPFANKTFLICWHRVVPWIIEGEYCGRDCNHYVRKWWKFWRSK